MRNAYGLSAHKERARFQGSSDMNVTGIAWVTRPPLLLLSLLTSQLRSLRCYQYGIDESCDFEGEGSVAEPLDGQCFLCYPRCFALLHIMYNKIGLLLAAFI